MDILAAFYLVQRDTFGHDPYSQRSNAHMNSVLLTKLPCIRAILRVFGENSVSIICF